jgi:hypothetical protein
MTSTGPHDNPALAPLDGTDLALLDEVRALYTSIDAPPDDLVQRVCFALDLETLDIEVGRLTEQAADRRVLVGVRGEEHSRTITFDSESLTIMIMLSFPSSEMVRVDGWLAPPAPHDIEVRTFDGGTLTSRADDDGRFVAEPIPHGLVQIVVRSQPQDGESVGRTVVTPSIVV